MSAREIERVLREAFRPRYLALQDLSTKHALHPQARASGGGHYAVTIVSDRFSGCSPLARHRLVYDALAQHLKTTIHALAIRALAPQEWKSKRGSKRRSARGGGRASAREEAGQGAARRPRRP